jgi:chromate transporter
MPKQKGESRKPRICLELFLIFFKIGAITFGGGYVMLPYIYRELVMKRKWFNNDEIVDIFTVSQSIPGAIAVNAAFNTGFRKAGLPGGFMAVAGVVIPAFLAIVLILIFFLNIRESIWVQKFLAGILTASAALILMTAIDLAKTVYKKEAIVRIIISLLVFIGIGVFGINAMWMILGGVLWGLANYLYQILGLKKGENDED